MFSPTVPCQPNNYDCGVYVCRNIFALYQLCFNDPKYTFSYNAASVKPPVKHETQGQAQPANQLWEQLTTMEPLFRFGPADIRRIRNEFETLVRKLHILFIK